MAKFNPPAVIAAPLPAANNSAELAISNANPTPVHVALKIIRFPYEGEEGSHESIEGFLSGISYKVITNPEEIEAGFQPFLEPATDLSGQWKMVKLAVVGGFYCTLGEGNEIQNPTGMIIPPSRTNKFGTVDISKAPNGLLYILHLRNGSGQHSQALYFDPQLDIKKGRINKNTVISFPHGPKKPNLQLFAEEAEKTLGRFVFKRTIMVATRPIGRVACYVSGDIKREQGKHVRALTS